MTAARKIRMLVTGGGTGGHTYPALTTITAVCEHAAAQGRDVDVLWVGTAEGLEARIAAEHHIPFKVISAGKVRRSPNLRELGRNVIDLFKVPIGVLQAAGIAARYRPDVVLSTGGYVSVPLGLAARLLGRPLVMHEQRYHPTAYVGEELPDVYAAADVVVSRSGAGTVAELVAVGKPSVLIPLVPAAGDEQRNNARYLVGAGAARALLEPDPTPQQLLAELDELLLAPGLRARMTDAAKALGRPDAADALAKVILGQAN